MERYNVRVNGTVQGVGFRYTTQIKAEERGLTGWVKNKSDGSVELEIQGQSDEVHSFIESLYKVRFPAKVEDVHSEAISSLPQEESFSIRH